jgi:cell division protein FtsW (lipid II flippase)
MEIISDLYSISAILGILAIFSMWLQIEVNEYIKHMNAHRLIILLAAICSFATLLLCSEEDKATIIVISIIFSIVFAISFGLPAYNPKKWRKQWEEDTRLEFVEVARLRQQRMAASECEQERKSKKS